MKKKVIKGSKRGITFSDRALFPIHSKIKYTIDKKQKRLLIALIANQIKQAFKHYYSFGME